MIDTYLDDLDWAFASPSRLNAFVEVAGRQTSFAEVSLANLQTPGSKLNSIHSFSKAAIFLSLSSRLQRFLEMMFDEPAALLQSLTFWRGSQQVSHIGYPYVRT